MMSAQTSTNNLSEFKKYIEGDEINITDYANAVQYKYKLNLNLYNNNANSESYVRVAPNQIMEKLGMEQMQEMSSNFGGMTVNSNEVWEEMLDNDELLKSQYDVVAGKWAENLDEVVLILDRDGKISDYTLYALGLLDPDDLAEKYQTLLKGEEIEKMDVQSYTYDELLDLTFKLVLNTDYYKKEGNYWKDMQDDKDYMNNLLNDAMDVKVVGIIKPNEEAVGTAMSSSYGGIGYKSSLKEYVIEQKENEKINVFTGMEFSEKNEDFDISKLSTEEMQYISSLSQTELAELMQAYSDNNNATYESNLEKLGVVNIDEPSGIYIYPKNFEAKENKTKKKML